RNLLKKINFNQSRTLVIKSLAIRNLPLNTTKEELIEVLSQKEVPQKAVRIFKNNSGESTGLAFIDIDEADIDSSISKLDNLCISDRLISVQLANPRQTGNILQEKKIKGELVTLMVYNLPSEISLQELNDLFSQKVPVLAVRILNRDKQVTNRVGFVDVAPQHMSTAIKEFHDEVHFGAQIGVTLAANTFMPAFRVIKNRHVLSTLRLENVPEGVERTELLAALNKEFPVFGLENVAEGAWKLSVLEGSLERAINVLGDKLIGGVKVDVLVQ
ncbi:hypothetical protein CONCODRAFT_77949, partial [Conidiobolus coronatus NRRL 28638]